MATQAINAVASGVQSQVQEHDCDDEFDLPTTYSIEESADILLGRLVLAKAADDALLPHDGKEAIDARIWLTNDSEDLRMICAVARIDALYLIENWRRRLGRVWQSQVA